jgi:alcohol dehydrogenase
MKALVYHAPESRAWEEVPAPTLLADTDAIVRVDATAICGSGLHILEGHVPEVTAGRILGHEAVGTIHRGGLNGEHHGSATVSWSPALRPAALAGSAGRHATRSAEGDGGWILGHTHDVVLMAPSSRPRDLQTYGIVLQEAQPGRRTALPATSGHQPGSPLRPPGPTSAQHVVRPHGC